jgi:arylsulfatase A-like enzyme
LIVYPEAPQVRLYNIAEDPLEMNDLAKDPANASIVDELLENLIALQKEMHDELDLTSIRK